MVEYEDPAEAMDTDRPAKPTRLKSTVHTAQGRNIKGRGQNQGNDRMVGDFERLEDGGHHEDSSAQKSVDGWVVFCTNLHEEATTEDLQEVFCEFGEVRNSWMNLDRQTGYVKGYALIEYRTRDEAEAAIQALDGTKFLDRTIRVSWAFVKPPMRGGGRRR